MQDFLLILVMLAAFIFGWFLMKKVDIFLEEWQKEMNGQHETEEQKIIMSNMYDGIKGQYATMKREGENAARRKPGGIVKTKPGSAFESNQ